MSRAPIQYVKGDWKAVCDSCGKRFLASSLRQRWDGLMVCPSDFEVRQPQDFVRARVDHMTVPYTRKEPADTFVSVGAGTSIAGWAVPMFVTGSSINL